MIVASFDPEARSHADTSGRPAIVELAGVSKSFHGTVVLDNVSLEVRAGEVCTLIGPSGSGKTTLLRCLNGLSPIDFGTVRVNGNVISSIGQGGVATPGNPTERQLAKARQDIGFVFQHFNLFPHLTVLDNITLAPRRIKGMARRQAEERAHELLKLVSLGDKAGTMPGNLSGGQKQRVAIARTLAMDPSLILFDEVTSALDPERVGEVLDVIRDLAIRGMTMMIVTHEMRFARQVSSRIIFMEGGKIIEDGPPAQVFDAPVSPRTRLFLSRSA